ncbi:MAG: TonB-dependent receptor [Nitrospirae bacterium]|nr:MAG: TonB-dependent receptor [Nitrospirota bacterium]
MYHFPQKSLSFRSLFVKTGLVTVLISIFLLSLTFQAIAQDQQAEGTEITEIVVTATRYEEERSLVPADVTVIDERQISESTAKTVPELLRKEPGLFVTDLTGSGRNVTVDLRGYGETGPLNTLVLVDGRRVNQPDLSGTDWTQIPLERVKRIEIIRGSKAAVLYGDNASGGVINIITKEGEERRYGITIGAGSYGTTSASAYASGSLKGLSYYLNGTYGRTDGYRENGNDEAKDLGFDLRYYIGEKLRLGLSGGYHKDSAGLPGALKVADLEAGRSRRATDNPFDFSKVEDYYIKADGEYNLWGESFLNIDLSYRKRGFLSFASFSGGNFLGDTEIDNYSIAPRVLIVNQGDRFRNELSLGFDYFKASEDIENTSLFFGDVTKGVFTLERETYGYYLHDEVSLSKRFFVSGGYRYDRAEYAFTPSTPSGITLDENVYSLGVTYRVSDNINIYANYARGFRYPVIDELYSFFTNTIDTTLIPQRSDDYEAGIRARLEKGLNVELNLFRIDTSDEIFYNPNAFMNQNMDGDTRREGVEFTVFYAPFDFLSLDGTCTFTRTEIRGGSFDGHDIPGVPENKITGHLNLKPIEGLGITLETIHVGKRPYISDFDNAFGDLGAYTVLNMKTSYTKGNITAFLNLNNLTDEEYEEYGVIRFPGEQAVYPSPGLNVFGGLSLTF